jgi:hypothetical protein
MGCNCPPYSVTENCKKCNIKVSGPDMACAGQDVTYTATTVGGGTVTWKVSGVEATPNTGTGTTFTTKFKTNGNAVVEADLVCDNKLTDQHGVNVKVIGLEIKVDPGSPFVFTAEPKMPTINAHVKVLGADPDPTDTTTFEWTTKVTLLASDCPHGREVKYERKESKTGKDFSPTFDVIRGGSLVFEVTATINGCNVTGTSKRP